MNQTEKIYRILLSELENGKYPVGSRFPSEYDLSDRFRVNKDTVNRAVLRLVERGLLRRGKRGSGTSVVRDQLFPKGRIAYVGKINRYTMEIMDGIQNCAWSRGYACEILSPPENQLQRMLDMITVDGIITAQYGIIRPRDGVETVYIDCDLPEDSPLNRVNCDNYEAGTLMMREILKRGHRNIAVFCAMRRFLSRNCPYQQRIQAFHAEMRAAGIHDCLERTFSAVPDSPDDIARCLKRMMEQYPDLTLIAADSDFTVQLLWNIAGRSGIRLPALTGFGNITDLPCATVDQQQRRLGEYAARCLLDRLERPDAVKTPIREKLNVSLLRTEMIPVVG